MPVQITYLIRLVLIIYLLFAWSLRADSLLLAFDTPGVKISEQEQQRLTTLLARYSKQRINRAPIKHAAEADVLLTSGVVGPDWYLSNIVVAYIPAMVALSVEQQPHLTQSAQVSRDYMLSATNIDAVPENSNVSALLQAERYSSIIDFSTAVATHSGYYKLQRRQVYSGQHIRIASRDARFSEHLVQQLLQSEDAEFQVLAEDKVSITLQYVAKSLNSDSGLLEESVEDVAFVEWLHEALPEFDFKTEVTSSADAALKLTQADAVCTVNGRKRSSATGLAFSWPTQLYLGPRLYTSPTQPLAELISKMVQQNDAISLSKLIKMLPELRVSTIDILATALPEQEPGQVSQHLVLPLSRVESATSLLQRKRVDAVWLYPVMFRLSANDADFTANIISLSLADSGVPVPAFLVCNQHASSLALIKEVNQQLAASEQLQSLLDLYSVGLPQTDRTSYQQAFKQLILQAEAEAAKAKPSKR